MKGLKMSVAIYFPVVISFATFLPFAVYTGLFITRPIILSTDVNLRLLLPGERS